MKEKDTEKFVFSNPVSAPQAGRLISLDWGTKKIGVAICDELQISVRRLTILKRNSWKKILREIVKFIEEYDAHALIIGLPLNSDGTESDMSVESRRIARNFSLSLSIPVFLQDERVTTYDARRNLWDMGYEGAELSKNLDSEAAAIILDDFLSAKATTEKT